ncbi:SSI family serine proteinase inhibitor [Gaiella sp.]|uniref:SSI family serine proteinase inhibitor n=1 Tax=Gaiella sp. TaxID=2663207 RepID=UPI003982F508
MRLGIGLILIAAACAAFPTAASAGAIALKIIFRATPTSAPQTLTLRCGSMPTGSVPSPAAACRRLQILGPAAFRPTPPDTACTEIYGGPSTARVTGTYFGSRLWVRLGRANGCEIGRWQRVAFLLPRPGAP